MSVIILGKKMFIFWKIEYICRFMLLSSVLDKYFKCVWKNESIKVFLVGLFVIVEV